MYVTRAALDRCGFFDEEAFGRGYGEEVDLCLRATRQGMRHLVEDSTYVHHYGAVSFGDEREANIARASRIIHRRYPHFREANKRERSREPLLSSFTSLELGLSDRDPSRPHVLQMLHSPPGAFGGTEKHVTALLNGAHRRVRLLGPAPRRVRVRAAHHVGPRRRHPHRPRVPAATGTFGARPMKPRRAAALRMALDSFDFDAVHIQNLIGYSLAPLDVLADFDGPVVCSVRDLFLACPNHSLLYRNRQGLRHPRRPLLLRHLPPRDQEPRPRRPERVPPTASADTSTPSTPGSSPPKAPPTTCCASTTSTPNASKSSPTAPSSPPTEPNPSTRASSSTNPSASPSSDAAGPRKASTTVNHLADQLADTTIEIHHFGEHVEQRSPQVHAHGTYDNQFLPDLLRLAGIQIVLLPGPYAETFGHVMTEALIAGIPVIGATYGALGERIRAHGRRLDHRPRQPPRTHHPHPTTRPQPPRTPPRHPPGRRGHLRDGRGDGPPLLGALQ